MSSLKAKDYLDLSFAIDRYKVVFYLDCFYGMDSIEIYESISGLLKIRGLILKMRCRENYPL